MHTKCDSSISGDAAELLSKLAFMNDMSRQDSYSKSTFGDATIITALKPIQNGVKRFIGEEEKWTPIKYEFAPDDTDWLEPKLSCTSPKHSNSSEPHQLKIVPKPIKISSKKKKKKGSKKCAKKSGLYIPTPIFTVQPSLSMASSSSYSSHSSHCSSLSVSMSPFATGGAFSDEDGDLIFTID
eukprot:UN02553